ncbi:MAG: hypothetical protein NVS9B15_19760 [Acidobacteriaceae bacterium]
MATPAFKAQLRRLFLAPLLGLSLLALVLGFAIYRLQWTARWVDHTDQVLATMNDLQRLMIDQEAGLRGYLLTHNTKFLAPERSSTPRIRSDFRQLAQLVFNNPEQKARLAAIAADYEVWEKMFFSVEVPRSAEERSSVLDLTRVHMEKLRGEIASFRTVEETLRHERVQRNEDTLTAVYWATAILALLTGAGLAVWTHRTSRRMNEEYERRIAEQKRMHDELLEKNELVDLAQAAAHAGFWHFDQVSDRAYLTPGCKRLFGMGLEDQVTGTDVLAHIHEEDRARIATKLREAMTTGHYYAEFRVPQQDGSTRWLAGQARTLKSRAGTPYLVGINIDITPKKLAEEALMRNEKLAVVGRMAATISHEINNPLEAVTNLLYLIESGVSPAEQQQFAKLAQEELSRVSHIVSHTLRFQRQATNATQESLPALLDTATALYQGRLLNSGITLRRDYRATEPVQCYGAELRQVFANLIGNAFDATRSGGTIIVRTRKTHAWRTGEPAVRVSIADTGSGMDEATRKRLFEPFFTTKGINGTGLGLWVSVAILEKHQASMRVKSAQRPGASGTVFSIVIPVRSNPAGEIAAADAA